MPKNNNIRHLLGWGLLLAVLSLSVYIIVRQRQAGPLNDLPQQTPSAELDADRITVEAHDGSVTLKGTVHSYAERRDAERAAWASNQNIAYQHRRPLRGPHAPAESRHQRVPAPRARARRPLSGRAPGVPLNVAEAWCALLIARAGSRRTRCACGSRGIRGRRCDLATDRATHQRIVFGLSRNQIVMCLKVSGTFCSGFSSRIFKTARQRM